MHDLHAHTLASDGALTLPDLLTRAQANGVHTLAITDHDVVTEIPPDLCPPGLRTVAGVEISTRWDGREIHVVGLQVEAQAPQLAALLESQQALRWERVTRWDSLLTAAGMDGLSRHLAGASTVSPGRSHVADFLIKAGKAKSRQRAFAAYLGRGKKFHLPTPWCDVSAAIRAIQAAGGMAVLAHPHRYADTVSGLRRLARAFREAGGDGMEVACANIDNGMLARLAQVSQEAGLLASSGSDFHTTDAIWMDLGRLPELPETCRGDAVWASPRWQSD